MTSARNAKIKYSAYGLVLLALYLLQSSQIITLSLWEAELDVLPFFVASVALLEGALAGAAYGFSAGVLSAVISPYIDGLSAAHLAMFGLVFGWFGARYMRRIMPSAILGGVVSLVLKWLVLQTFFYGLYHGMPPMVGFKLFSGQLLLSILPGCGIFFIVNAINRRFAEYD